MDALHQGVLGRGSTTSPISPEKRGSFVGCVQAICSFWSPYDILVEDEEGEGVESAGEEERLKQFRGI